MARLKTTMLGELRARLAETGASNDYWLQTDLDDYINKGVRMVAEYGRLSLLGSLITSDAAALSAYTQTVQSNFIRFADPNLIGTYTGLEGNFPVPLVTLNQVELNKHNGLLSTQEKLAGAWVTPLSLLVFTVDSGTMNIKYIKEPISATTELKDKGDDYALDYAFGMALTKGGFNLNNGLAIMKEAKEGVI
jgi:hypothetical protein